MKFARTSRAGRQASAVELTPLIDVVFLLLIFFMVSTTFVRPSVLAIDLPEASGAVDEPSFDDTVVQVNTAGEYVVNGKPLPETGVEALVAALAGGTGEGRRLVVAADARARHRAVVRVLDAASRLGIGNMYIVTRDDAAQPNRDKR